MCCYFFIKCCIELWIHWAVQWLHQSRHQNVWMCVWAVFVVLQGSSSCEIENHGGVVTLRPLPGCVCLLNHREVTEPCRLAQGQLVSIKNQSSLFSLSCLTVVSLTWDTDSVFCTEKGKYSCIFYFLIRKNQFKDLSAINICPIFLIWYKHQINGKM